MESEKEKRKRVSNPRGGKRENSGGARDGAGAPKKEERGGYKTRNWATIIYPESEKSGWRDILRGWCVQAFVSPLHDKDKDPTGEPKKAHYHVLLMYDGPRSRSVVEKQIKEELGGVGCQPCNSARGYARYLCHLDNPDKYQYPVGDVEAFCGADYLEVIQLESDRRVTVAEMCQWCDETGCVSFAELCREARRNHPVWWQAITAHSTMIMFRYIRSLEDELKKGGVSYQKVVPHAVEVVETPDGVKRVSVATGAVLEPVDSLQQARDEARRLEQRLTELQLAIAGMEARDEANAGK